MIRYLKSLQQISKNPSQIVVIGSQDGIQKDLKETTSVLADVLHFKFGSNEERVSKSLKTENRLEFFQSIVSELKPLNDTGVKAENWISNNNGSCTRVSICLLPTAISRHNSPARPHAITEFVKNCNQKGNTLILLILDDKHHAFAAGCAVARAGFQYSRKNQSALGIPAECMDFTTYPEEFSVLFSKDSEMYMNHIQATADNIQLACRLVDAPPNELHTDTFIKEAENIAKKLKVETTIIQGKELEKQGFGGIYGVGKAAIHQPALVVLSHVPEMKDNDKSIVMVGKGIVYDTGGLSIKTKDFMPGMKRDMGGAAALLGAFAAAVSSGCKRPLHAILCLAENAVGPIATKPDDVHIMYSGKSVEINNTDAEGRLVLGDGVAYAVRHLNPDLVIDMATLTGAQGVATGKNFGALYCNNEEIETIAVQAGRFSGDLCHPLPYAPEFFRKEFKSAIADMKNSVKSRSNAQSSCAGQFIGNHLGEYENNGKWLHVDMAYPSFTDHDERATGYGVALIQGILCKLKCFGP